jgi:hypothetical protein
MKTSLCFSIAVAFLVTGCNDQSKSPPGQAANAPATNTSTGGSLLTAPVDYLAAAARAQQTAVKTVDLAALTRAIQSFQAEQGRNPKDLDELVQNKDIPKIPVPPYGTKLDYNPDTGEVKVVKAEPQTK